MSIADPVAHRTMLVATVGGFGGLGEHCTAEQMRGLLDETLAVLHDAVAEHGGRMGWNSAAAEQVVALFGDPPAPEIAAVRAALAMVERWQQQAAQRRAQGLPGLQLYIGMHAARLWSGPLGRIEPPGFVTVGQEAVVARRLAELCRRYDVRIIASEAVTNPAAACFELRPLDPIPVKGRVDELPVAEVLGLATL